MQTECAKLLSIQVGKPKKLSFPASDNMPYEPFESGIVKLAVNGPVLCKKLNLVGDGQADLINHGGPDKAVLFYNAAHYPVWRDELSINNLQHGGFGENFTVLGLSESSVCIGDNYKIGDAIFEISQPRRPCWKLDKRWHRDDLLGRVEEKAWSGWYARVLIEGFVAAGDAIELIRRPLPRFTVEYVTRVVQQRKFHRDDVLELVDCSLLSESIRRTLRKSLNRTGE